MRIGQLFPAFAGDRGQGCGPGRRHAAAQGHGHSIADAAAKADGRIAATVVNGRISNLLDAASGLNGGKVLALLLGGDKDIVIRCGGVNFDVADGRGKSTLFVIDTEQTQVLGSGSFDLAHERFDLHGEAQAQGGRPANAAHRRRGAAALSSFKPPAIGDREGPAGHPPRRAASRTRRQSSPAGGASFPWSRPVRGKRRTARASNGRARLRGEASGGVCAAAASGERSALSRVTTCRRCRPLRRGGRAELPDWRRPAAWRARRSRRRSCPAGSSSRHRRLRRAATSRAAAEPYIAAIISGVVPFGRLGIDEGVLARATAS